ncbi:MAG: hypothetical protein WC492_01285 [Candidatus Micrarchaeia archaeon]|jgi:hypothetical protein
MATDMSAFHEKTKTMAILIHDLQYVLDSKNTAVKEKPYIQEVLTSLKKQYLNEYNNFVQNQSNLSTVYKKTPSEEKKRTMVMR